MCAISCYDWRKLGIIFLRSRNSALIKCGKFWYLTPRSYLLLIHNKIADMLSVLVLAAVTPDVIYARPCLQITELFIKEWCWLAQDMGDKLFSLSKVLEALVIGETLIKIEGQGNRGFLNSVIEGLTESNIPYVGSKLQTILQESSVLLMHELACLSKIMGHPYCKMEETAEDLHDKTHEERFVNLAMVVDAVRNAKQDFVCRYILRHGKWPAVEFNGDPPLNLVQARRLDIDPTRASHQMRYGVLNLTAWDHVTILKCETFHKLENFIPYVKDRTVSLSRSKVISYYFAEDPENKPKYNWIETRALLAYLLLPMKDTSHEQHLDYYSNEDWEMMEDLLVIRLVPKEKEHKVKARCFGCKPIQERARTIVLGHNAASFLHKYSDNEVMTLSELSLSRKLYSFRNMYQAYKNYDQIIICLDASGWNSRLRNAALAPIAGSVLDGVFGETMFRQFHKTYEFMYVYLPDAEDVYQWDGQFGGIEGLDQYIWVHSYIAHLNTVLNQFGLPFQLLVKGDDARIVILVPPQAARRETIDELKTRLVAEITEGAAQFGHLMKTEDSYASQKYCAFSKNAFINNTEQPQSFRKCQKAYGANNAFMNTLDDYVASSYSNCHSTAKTSPTPISCYVLALWWMLIALLRDKRYKDLPNATLCAFTLLPNLLGGFPIVFLHNFFQRAESDLLSSFCQLYKFIKRRDQEVGDILDKAWHQKVLNPSDNLTLLCIDPYSLPLYKPPPAQSILRKHLRATIQWMTNNADIKDLFNSLKTDFQEALMRILHTLNVYNSKVMSIIHSCSPEGIIMELLTKFESGKSVMDAIILKKNFRIGRKVLAEAAEADNLVHEFRTKLVQNRISQSEFIMTSRDACGALMAQTLRETYWKKTIEGITQPPAFHTVQIGTFMEFLQDRTADQRHFTVRWEVPDEGRDGSLFKEGHFQAFLGDSTSKGLCHPEVKLMTENLFAIKITKLLDIYKWTLPSAEIPEGMQSIAE